MPPRRAPSGFTLVELVVVIIILGVLAAVALPRFNDAMSFRAVEFRDKTITALRHAQKTATSHRRLVCVAFAADSVTLTIDHDRDNACNGQPLTLPGGGSNVVTSGDAQAVFASVPAELRFQPDGRGTDGAGNVVTLNASIDGLSVYVAGATGYVGDAP